MLPVPLAGTYPCLPCVIGAYSTLWLPSVFPTMRFAVTNPVQLSNPWLALGALRILGWLCNPCEPSPSTSSLSDFPSLTLVYPGVLPVALVRFCMMAPGFVVAISALWNHHVHKG